MSGIGAFVHLYHVWGLYCLITAIVFGIPAYRRWMMRGGRWSSLPRTTVEAGHELAVHMVRDWVIFWRWVGKTTARLIASERGAAWPSLRDEWDVDIEGNTKHAPLSLFVGISVGGWGGFTTAMYWAEKNKGWMTDDMAVLWPSFFVTLTVISHVFHQFTAWPDKPYIPRMLLGVSLCWIAIGGLTGGLT